MTLGFEAQILKMTSASCSVNALECVTRSNARVCSSTESIGKQIEQPACRSVYNQYSEAVVDVSRETFKGDY